MGNVKNPYENLVILQGKLTRDPELKYTSGGIAYCRFSVAWTEWFKKDGERQSKAHFFEGTVWGKRAEYFGERGKKGMDVHVKGRLDMNEWEDRQTGQKRTQIRIMAEGILPMEWDSDHAEKQETPYHAAPPPETDIPEDDIPF